MASAESAELVTARAELAAAQAELGQQRQLAEEKVRLPAESVSQLDHSALGRGASAIVLGKVPLSDWRRAGAAAGGNQALP